jgi:putative membrane protein
MSKDVKNTQTNDCPISKHTPKSFMLAFVLGVVIGLAIIVPGVSGSTVAIMFGMYAALLYAIGNIFNDFKRCVSYLIPIGIGAAIGFIGGFLVIQEVFGKYMLAVVCLFAGLMCGAVPAITNEISGEKRTAGRLSLSAVGFLIPIAVGTVSILLSGEGSSTESFSAFPAHLFLLYIPLGIAVSATQIIPGLSATAILMACGQFAPILNSLHLDYILENPAVLGLYACIGSGFVGGIVLISRIFSKILEKHRAPAFFLVVGLSLGSIASMFINNDMWEIYSTWSEHGNVTTLVVGIVLFAVGFALSLMLTRYELKKARK